MTTTAWGEGDADISAHGLALFFSSDRPGGQGDWDMWFATRGRPDAPWSEPMNLGATVNSPNNDRHPSISADGLSLFFSSDRPDGYGDSDLWVSTRETVNDHWSEPVNLGPIVNGPSADSGPDISSDGLNLFFDSERPGGYGESDIWLTRRATIHAPWSQPVNLGPIVNTPGDEDNACISADDSILYFNSYGLLQVPIEPLVDLNGDGIVDSTDRCIMVDHWGEYYPWCDIGPTPLGDGVIGVQDLIVLAEHLSEDVNDPTLVAHWALDETEGMTAHDSAADHDGTVMGAALWLPDGMVDGALGYDGATCVATDFVLNPQKGPFSVFSWVRGGAAGQVIISQETSANWLMLDLATGALMTELCSGSRQSKALYSDAVITDGNWHRIGFAWDSVSRALYADDILVAEDIQEAPASCAGGMNIGSGKNMAPGTYWTGLIDDVRIYNRAVKP